MKFVFKYKNEKIPKGLYFYGNKKDYYKICST
jgi:hypothetical protein